MLDKPMYPKGSERQKIMGDFSTRSDGIAAVYARNHPQEHDKFDKKVRREIANSNERRRMQSINAGYDALKALIPHHDGEKLSKAAILQQTGEHIQALEEEKAKLVAQNDHLKSLLLEREHEREREKEHLFNDSPPPKRKKRDTECSDEGISMSSSMDSNEDATEDIQRAMMELRSQLDKERWMRMVLEERTRTMLGGTKLHKDQKCDVNNVYVQTDFNKVTNDYTEVKTHCNINRDHYTPYKTSRLSQKNLETMLEAARHLEGDRLVFEDWKYEDRVPNPKPTALQMRSSSHPHHSEDSEKDSSDQDDVKSESSDQDLTFNYTHRIHRHRLQSNKNNSGGKVVPQISVQTFSDSVLSMPSQYYTSTTMVVHNS